MFIKGKRMRMSKALLLAPLALLASSAMAQSGPSDASDGASNGPRIEALIGYDRIEAGLKGTDDFDGNDEDAIYGVAIGYDFSKGMIAFGVEAEIAASAIGAEDRFDNLSIDGSLVSGAVSVDANPEYYIGARLGYGAGRRLFYVKAGYAMSSVDIDFDGTVDGVPDSFDGDVDLDGLRLGLNFEYAISDTIYLKTEYRYTDYTGGEIEALGAGLRF